MVEGGLGDFDACGGCGPLGLGGTGGQLIELFLGDADLHLVELDGLLRLEQAAGSEGYLGLCRGYAGFGGRDFSFTRACEQFWHGPLRLRLKLRLRFRPGC